MEGDLGGIDAAENVVKVISQLRQKSSLFRSIYSSLF